MHTFYAQRTKWLIHNAKINRSVFFPEIGPHFRELPVGYQQQPDVALHGQLTRQPVAARLAGLL
jgi:hypothetical protein